MGKLDELGDSVRQVIRAYHGSPYDFDRFDASKIGTGEGAQAYGHGLYFAESEPVARGYRDSLSGHVIIDGEPMPDSMAGNDYILANALANKQYEHIEDWRRKAQERYSYFSRKTEEARARYQQDPDGEGVLAELGRVKHAADLEADVLAAFRRFEGRRVERNPGRMYEVEIAHPANTLLDWDAPISQQPQAVRRAFGEFAIDRPGDGRRVYQDIAARRGEEFDDDMTGFLAHRAAAQELLQEGIPGIRYLDGNSRSSGQGTRNYVMFPGTEDSIRILRKYAIPGAVGTGAAAQYGEE